MNFYRRIPFRIIILFLLLHSVLLLRAQSELNTLPDRNYEITRNNVYLMAGFTTGTSGASLVYERNLKVLKKGELNARAGFGVYQFFWSGEGGNLLSTLSYISGVKNNHFECCLGATVLFGSSDYPNWYPAAYMGYRYKKPDGKFLFRAGLGWPDQLGVSAGYCF